MESTYGQEPFESAQDEQEFRLITDYLQQASPAQQFYFVCRMNYDSHRQVVRWLIDRPETNRATVLALYWNLGADYFCQFADEGDFDEEDDYLLEDWRFTRLIEARYVGGFYPQGVVYFNPYRYSGACPGEYTDIERKYTPPPQMLATVEGTEYVDVDDETDNFTDYDDGLPPDVAKAVWALYDEE